MTYKSEGSLLSSYLYKVKVPAKVANDNVKDESFRQAARELIDVQDIPAQNILITCAKPGWYKNGNKKVAGPLASGSKLFQGANWIPNTTGGTNDYMHCSHLIYLYDQHINPVVARWLEDSTGAFNDAYALTELIQ